MPYSLFNQKVSGDYAIYFLYRSLKWSELYWQIQLSDDLDVTTKYFDLLNRLVLWADLYWQIQWYDVKI